MIKVKGGLLFSDNKGKDCNLNATNYTANDRFVTNNSKCKIESTLWHVVFRT